MCKTYKFFLQMQFGAAVMYQTILLGCVRSWEVKSEESSRSSQLRSISWHRANQFGMRQDAARPRLHIPHDFFAADGVTIVSPLFRDVHPRIVRCASRYQKWHGKMAIRQLVGLNLSKSRRRTLGGGPSDYSAIGQRSPTLLESSTKNDFRSFFL